MNYEQQRRMNNVERVCNICAETDARKFNKNEYNVCRKHSRQLAKEGKQYANSNT